MTNVEHLRRYIEEGSQEAFTELVRSHLNLVYAAALRQLEGNAHDAQEVAQAVFTDLARKARSLSHHTSLTGWLYTSTHFAAAKLRRTTRRRQLHEREAFIMNELTAPQDAPVNWEKLRPVLDGAMQELSAHDREAVLLRYFEDQSFTAVGAQLNLGENAARMRVQRALDKLSGLLARRGIHSTGAALSLALTGTLSAAPAGLAATISAGAMVSAVSTTALSAAAIFKIMGTLKFVSAVTFVAAAAVGTALYEARSVQHAETALSAVTLERDSLRAQLITLSSANSSPHLAPIQTAALPTQVIPAPSVASVRLETPKKLDPTRLTRFHRELDAFIKQRGLTPDQGDRLIGILADWEDVSKDFQASIRAQGLMATPEAQKLRDRMQIQLENEPLAALLGSDGESAYFDFETRSFYQGMVEPFSRKLTEANLPLNEDQANQLAVLVEANTHQEKRDPTSMSNRAVVDWPAVITASNNFLNAKQITVMKAYAPRLAAGR